MNKCEKGKSCVHCNTNYCRFVDEVKELMQENARLKEELETAKLHYKYEEEFAINYKQALDEIRGIAEIENIPDIISPNDLATFYLERTQQLKKIQNKVNEVL